MGIVVQKYGGSSVADVDKIRKVAQRIVETKKLGHDVVVTVSAMGDTTDQLLSLAHQVSPRPIRREMDMLVTTGERISMALLSMAIQDLGFDAVSLTGSQSGIITNNQHTDARIMEVRPVRIHQALAEGKIVIVAGYQGVSKEKEITTLGRGGTDTTAVALAAALNAEWCEICSDVDGVYTADPRVVPEAKRIPKISHQETQELAESGARIFHAQAVEFAKEKNIAIFARDTFEGKPGPPNLKTEGTLVEKSIPASTGRVIGIAHQKSILILEGTQMNSSAWEELLVRLDEAGVPGKQIHFSRVSEGSTRLSMVIDPETLADSEGLQTRLKNQIPPDTQILDALSAISLIGSGINDTHANVRKGLEVLSNLGIQPHGVTTSSFRITYLVSRDRLEETVQELHRAFIE